MKINKIISLEQAAAGMILAQDVLDANGNRLMAAGVILTTSLLNSLVQRGIINSVAIEFEQELNEQEISAQREACVAHLEHRFRQLKDNADMQQLKNILLAYRLNSLP